MKRNFSANIIAIMLSFVNIALFVFLLVATDLFSQKDLWFQSSCVIIGTIVTAVITLLLLNGQSDKEEENERNAKVFEEKLAIYKEFLNTLYEIVKDGKITDEESKKLQFQAALISMHTSEYHIEPIAKSIADIIANIRKMDVGDQTDFSLVKELFTIQNQFKKELYSNNEKQPLTNRFFLYKKKECPKEKVDIVKIFQELEQNETVVDKPKEKLNKFENQIKEVIQKYRNTNDFNNGFEITLSQNGNSKNFIRFARLNTERGEYCVQVWLNLLNIDERRGIYIKLKDKFQPSIYSANHCAQIYFDYVKDGKYRFIDTFASEIEKLDTNTIDRFSKRIIEITNFVEEQLKNKE